MRIAASGCFVGLHEGHQELLTWIGEIATLLDLPVTIAVNTHEYAFKKHGDKYPSNPVWNVRLQEQVRRDNIFTWMKSKFDLQLDVIISDDVLSEIQEEIIWIVGDDHICMQFKEVAHVAGVITTKRTTGKSTTALIEEVANV